MTNKNLKVAVHKETGIRYLVDLVSPVIVMKDGVSVADYSQCYGDFYGKAFCRELNFSRERLHHEFVIQDLPWEKKEKVIPKMTDPQLQIEIAGARRRISHAWYLMRENRKEEGVREMECAMSMLGLVQEVLNKRREEA